MRKPKKSFKQEEPTDLYIVEIRMMVNTPAGFDLSTNINELYGTTMDGFINSMCTEMEAAKLQVTYAKPRITKI